MKKSIAKVMGLALVVLMNVSMLFNTKMAYAQEGAAAPAEQMSGTAIFFQKFFQSFKWSEDASSYMWIIALCAVFAVAMISERLYFIFVRSNVDANKFMAEIRKLVAGGNLKKAIALCETAKDKALPSVVLAGLKRAVEKEGGPLDFRAIQNAVDEGTLEIIPQLTQRSGYIAMLSNVSTLFGLMGTVYGLIISFAAVANPSLPEDQKALLLAGGISAAMQTTIWGLSVAIPCIISYTIITTKTTKIIDEMDEHMVKLINLMTGNR